MEPYQPPEVIGEMEPKGENGKEGVAHGIIHAERWKVLPERSPEVND